MGICECPVKPAAVETGCVCNPEAFPFVCARHGGCSKTEPYHKLCKTRANYFQLWESGRGPCLYDETTRPRVIGLGDAVAFAIRVVTFGLVKPWPGCGCQSRKAKLNALFSIRWPVTFQRTATITAN
ncbi:MAG: hypothetical protein EXS05_20620 [Planctomycetaceae bacterium]|nr:hypothetical protein [Planctomycetaceae bacterium]